MSLETKSQILSAFYGGELDVQETLARLKALAQGGRVHLLPRSAGGEGEPEGLLQPRWVEWSPARSSEEGEPHPGAILIVGPRADFGLGETLASLHEGRRVVRVEPGGEFGAERGDYFRIDSSRPEEFARLVHMLPEIGVVYFVALQEPGATADWGQVESDLDAGVFTLFHLIRHLRRVGRPFSLRVLANNAYEVTAGSEGAVCPSSAALLGLAKVVAREAPTVDVGALDLDRRELEGGAGPALRERVKSLLQNLPPNGSQSSGWEVAVRGQRPFVRDLRQVAPSSSEGGTSVRRGGVYLLLGGGGGIGVELARHLAGRRGASMLLAGRRTALPSAVLDDIQSLGGRALYRRVDINDLEEVRLAVRFVREEFGALHGIIHCASAGRFQGLSEMDAEAFREVFEVKTRGWWNVFEAAREAAPDFLVHFSSFGAFFADRGTAAYTAGCAFADALAAARASAAPFRLQTINWGLWGEIGMTADPAYVEKLFDRGVYSLSVAEGLDAFERVLGAGQVQTLALKASTRALRAMCWAPSRGRNPPREVHTPGSEMAEALRQHLATSRPGLAASVEGGLQGLNEFAQLHFLSFLQSRGAISAEAEAPTPASLREKLGVTPRYVRLLDAVTQELRAGGWVSFEEGRLKPSPRLTTAGPEGARALLAGRREALLAATPALEPHLKLVERTASRYEQLLRGEVPATDVLFEDFSFDSLEQIYGRSPGMEHFHDLLRHAVSQAVGRRRGKLRVLEIGAGTGATAAELLGALEKQGQVEYWYTDVSSSFLDYGRRRFWSRHPWVRFQLLDLEKEFAPQGVEPGSFDLVVAASVLHVSSQLQPALGRIREALAPGGVLLLLEPTRPGSFLTLTFGFLDGWWRYRDWERRRPFGPLLSARRWRALLTGEGFTVRGVFGLSAEGEDADPPQALLLAEREEEARLPEAGGRDDLPAQSLSAADARQSQATGLSAGRSLQVLERTLRSLVAAALHLEPSSIDVDHAFSEIGLDSILAIDFVAQVNADLGVEVKPLDVFNHGSVSRLARHIASNWPEARPSCEEPWEVSAPAAPAQPARVSSLAETAVARRPEAPPPTEREGVAVIGMSGRFPRARDLGEFWRVLADGVDAVSALPEERRRLQDWTPRGGIGGERFGAAYLDGVDEFDPLFFNISPVEARLMDPQQRLLLQEAWRAVEDAGYAARDLAGSRCGVFVGAKPCGYLDPASVPPEEAGTFLLSGNAGGMIGARLSYVFDLKGPCLVVDTECSSSLLAVHLACESLRRGESDLAIAAGVHVLNGPQAHRVLEAAHILSPTGRCRTFDAAADGIVIGEGVGVVVLKLLSRAVADGDDIRGVILCSGVNQDGRTNGITAPAGDAQVALQKEVYRRSGVNPDTVSYVEAHGTGTPLGDPIEVQSLGSSFREWTGRRQFCAIGSVKTNVGHTMAAAGIAGLLKILLAFGHRQIPPSLHFRRENPHLNLEEMPFYVPSRLTDWAAPAGQPRRAAINSFGSSGTNVHVLLEEPPPRRPNEGARPSPPFQLVVVSAKTRGALRRMCESYRDWLQGAGRDSSLLDFSYTLAVGRNHFGERKGFLVRDTPDLVAQLDAWLAEGRENAARGAAAQLDSVRTALDQRAAELTRVAGDPAASPAARRALLEELLQLYECGAEVDWRQFYGRSGGRVLPVPTYSFERERYWHGRPGPQPSHAEQGAGHSLLDGGKEFVFVKSFAPDDPAVAQHKVGGQGLVPAVVMLELARAAGAAVGAHAPLREFAWERPLVVDGSPRTVDLRLVREGEGLRFELTADEPGGRVTHASGLIPTAARPAGAKPLPVEEIHARCQSRLGGDELYRGLRENGFTHGPLFRVVEEIKHNGREAIARLDSAHAPWPSLTPGTVNPALLDGALQIVACLTSAGGEGRLKRFLPFAVREMQVLEAPAHSCLAYAELLAETADGLTRSYRITLCDTEGRPLVILGGVSFRALKDEGAADEGRARESAEVVSRRLPAMTAFYRPRWRVAEPVEGARPAATAALVLFDDDDELRKRLRADGLFAADVPVILVTAGTRFASHGGLHFELDPVRVEHYRLLLDELERLGMPLHFIHLWSYGAAAIDFSDAGGLAQTSGELARQLKVGIEALVCLGRALVERQPAGPCHLWAFAAHDPDCGEQPHQVMLAAALRTLRQEQPFILGRLVEVPARGRRGAEGLLGVLARELRCEDDSEVYVRYAPEGERRVRVMERLGGSDVTAPFGDAPLRRGGVYLMTGGMGGLGRLFGRSLAESYQAKLVLVARSPLDDVGRRWLAELEGLGSEAVYLQADVTVARDVERVVGIARERFGRLQGVIHAAGVLRDGFTLYKEASSVPEVLAPKLLGALCLDAATRGDELDFFALFSSLSSVVGVPGQFDYAAANAFMDSFARLRQEWVRSGLRRGKTLSINWPLWAEGGMQVGADLRQAMTAVSGLEPLPSEAGLSAWEVALRMDEPQLAVVYGAGAERFGAARAEPTAAAVRPASTALGAGSDGPGLSNYLISVFSEVLQLAPERIDVRASTDAFGIDSVLAIRITGRIEQDFGPLSKTLLFEYRTISTLAAHLGARRPDLVNVLDGGAPAAGPGGRELPRKHDAPDASAAGIAVVGVSGRYPMAEDLDAFWRNLKEGRDCITEVPPERWDLASYFDSRPGRSGSTYSRWGGFLKDVEMFDPVFFNIPPKDAAKIDPQERLFLECVWAALEDAGMTREYLASKGRGGGLPRVGVFVGVMYSEYHLLGRGGEVSNPSYASIANRVSYFFNLGGPSLAIDTMCSSSLTAIHLACESLKAGQCDIAIAGGVNLSLHPQKYLSLSEYRFASTDGRCRSFGAGGDGYVPGEGVGAVVLRPIDAALRDGDQVYGVIRGTGVNHGGRTQGYTVPNPDAQADLISRVLEAARVEPRAVSYIEAHGTGTPLGDPIEIAGLCRAFGAAAGGPQFCSVGSVKSNVGHLEAAAGVVALTKVLLQLRHRQLVPSLHAREINPEIDFTSTPFKVQQELGPWRPLPGGGSEGTRIAGVSSFGAGGANAFLLVEEHGGDERPAEGLEPAGRELVPLSARTPEQLRSAARRLLDWLDRELSEADGRPPRLGDVAHTLQVGREAMEVRWACVAADAAELSSKLGAFLTGRGGGDGSAFGDLRDAPRRGPDETERAAELARGGKLDELTALWAGGASLDWRRVWERPRGRRISLPHYSFERRRYWLDGAGDATNGSAVPGRQNVNGNGAAQPLATKAAGIANVAKAPASNGNGHGHAPAGAFVCDEWAPAETAAAGGLSLRASDAVVCFSRNEADSAWFRSWLASSTRLGGAPSFVAQPGAAYAERSDDRVEIDPLRQEDYTKFLSLLRRRNLSPAVIIYLWSLGETEGDVPDDAARLAGRLEAALAVGVRPLLLLSRALFDTHPQAEVRLFYTFDGNGRAADLRSAQHHAVGAFARSLAQENPGYRVTTVEIDEEPVRPETLSAALNEELESGGAAPAAETLYSGGRRWSRRIAPLPSPSDAPTPAVRQGGTYLVAGAPGSLGPTVVKYLVERRAGKVILLGRRALDEGAVREMFGAGNDGAQLIYAQADICDLTTLRREVALLRERTGPIHGVFHLARAVEDRLLYLKEPASFERVIRAKLHGTVHLDYVTKAEPLDFFVMFSSLTSLTGLGGSADYAFACAFQNGYARLRERLVGRGVRSGRSRSLAWPQWRHDRYLSAEKRERLAEFGFDPLEGSPGMEAFEQALGLGRPVVAVLHGDLDRLHRLLGIGGVRPARGALTREELEKWSEEELDRKLEELLTEAGPSLPSEAEGLSGGAAR